MKITLTTTFEQLHDARACKSRYHHLAKVLGGIRKYGRTTPINLRTILEHNGLADFFWVLETVIKADNQTVIDAIMDDGANWWVEKYWDSESDTTRSERVEGIKRLLK